MNGRGYRYPREIHLATLLLVTEEEEEQEVVVEEERVLGIASLRHDATCTTYRSALSGGRQRDGDVTYRIVGKLREWKTTTGCERPAERTRRGD